MLKKLFRTEVKLNPTKAKPYNLVSEVYSDLMDEVNYKRWAKYIYCIAKDKINPASDILELASGTCQLTSNLLHKNKRIICTDLSKQMLLQSIYPNKVVCDMVSLPFKNQFDLIFSTFDSINYLLSQKKIYSMFCEVNRCLRKDGIFTFDASLEKNSYIHQKDSKKNGSTKDFSYKRKSIFDPETRIHKNIFEITNKSGRVFTEVHKQKIYDFNTYFELLDKAGFYVVHCYKAFTLKDGNADTDRVQFIVKRK
jgi:ubiquinone/menaquinone biosynthesis C-methylase UbiE